MKVTFPDSSPRTYTAEVEIGDPLLAHTTELGYEEGLSVRPGGITVLRTGAAVLPEGTTFEVDRSQPLGGGSPSWTSTPAACAFSRRSRVR